MKLMNGSIMFATMGLLALALFAQETNRQCFVPVGLQGTWAVKNPVDITQIRITATQFEHTVTIRDKDPMTQSETAMVFWKQPDSIFVNTNMTPWQVDLWTTTGMGLVERKGVCEIKGDTMRIRLSEPSVSSGSSRQSHSDRPTTFESAIEATRVTKDK